MPREYVANDAEIAKILQQEEEHNYGKSSSSSSSSSSSAAAAAPIIVDISKTPAFIDKAEMERLDRLYAEELSNDQPPLNNNAPAGSRKAASTGRGRGRGGQRSGSPTRGRGRGGRGRGRSRRDYDDWDYGNFRTMYDDDYDEYLPVRGGIPGFRPQLPAGMNQLGNVDPRLLELMTRDINANDYELLLDQFGGTQGNKNKGATDAELDAFLVNVTHQKSKKSKKDDIIEIDLCDSKSNKRKHDDIILIDDDNDKKIEYEKEKENECSICLTQFVEGEQISILPCLHKFHKTCITNWLKISKKHILKIIY
jgi:hypothetical protein